MSHLLQVSVAVDVSIVLHTVGLIGDLRQLGILAIDGAGCALSFKAEVGESHVTVCGRPYIMYIRARYAGWS